MTRIILDHASSMTLFQMSVLVGEVLYDELSLYVFLQDLQKGLDLGVVSPEVLQNFFDLEQYPLISELTHRFQVSFVFGN